MKKTWKGLSFQVLAVVFFFLLPPVYSETIRDRATIHFNSIDWTIKENSIPFVEIPAVIIPGGNESFPVLSITASSAVSALYPEIEQLGAIDYSGSNVKLIELLTTLSLALKAQKIDSVLCTPERPFIAPLCTFQLQKLPIPAVVFFSRPVPVPTPIPVPAPATAPSLSLPPGLKSVSFSSKFRMQFLKNNVPSFVYLTVTAEKIEDAWKINEILFDGESYAGLAQQN